MYRLSLIISEVYNKYLPLAEKDGVSLNLDFSDTTATIPDPDVIKADLDKHLGSALSRTDHGEISIAVDRNAIIITDSGTILSRPICALLSNSRVSVSSRVGFGTTVRISLAPKPTSTAISNSETPAPSKATESILETQSEPSSATTPKIKPASVNPKKKPAREKSAPKSAHKAKPTREQRKLAAAAKKADRKIRKIQKHRKTQQKSQQSAQPQSASTSKQKSPKKTRKRIIELS